MKQIKNFLIFGLIVSLFVVLGKQEEVKANEIDLGQILVSSKRTAIDLSQTTDNVTIITADEIELLQVQNLSEVLGYVPEINIEPRQAFGRPTSLTIAGADSRQVRVMIDGIPLNSQASGQVNPAQFPIENIARIEIIKGGASSVWGSSLGGVVNIITKDTGETPQSKGNFTTSFSEFRAKRGSFDLSAKTDKLGYYLFSSYAESGGKAEKDDVLDKDMFGKLSYDLDEAGKITTSFGYSAADVNTGVFPDETWQSQPYRTRYGKIGWQVDSDAADIGIEFKQSNQEVITRTYLSPNDKEPFSVIQTKERLSQLSLNSTLYLPQEDLLVIGADFDWDIVKSSYISKAKSLRGQSPYLNYTQDFDSWNICYGLRYDSSSEFGQELSPSIGAVYHLPTLPETSLRASISRDFNTPPLLWKYYDLIISGVTTNPDIKAEQAIVYELGLESRLLPKLRTKFSLYRADIANAISLSTNDDGDYYMKNFEKFRRQGAELRLKLNISNELDLFCGGAFNDIEDRATRQTVKGGGKARQSFDLGSQYKNSNGLGILLRGYYNRWNQPASAQANDRKMICDLKISQQIKNSTLFLNIYNLTNSAYWADIYFPVKERYFEGGLTYKW